MLSLESIHKSPIAVAVGALSCTNVLALVSIVPVSCVIELFTLVISPSLSVICVCKPEIAEAIVLEELNPVIEPCSSVTFVDNVLIEFPWFVTVPDNVLIAFAFACKPVVAFVIEALRDVIFTDVDILALSLTP